MAYYRFDWQRFPPSGHFAAIGKCPDLPIPWTMGIAYEDPLPAPIRCSLRPRYGSDLPDMFLNGIPLFSERLLAVLEAAGVDDLVRYDAEIVDLEGRVHTNYKAINIVGAVSCADLDASEYLEGLEPPIMEFRKLVIDESRTHDRPMFRLAESSIVILIAERVRRAIESASLLGVAVSPIGD